MNLYRLDYETPDGRLTPCPEWARIDGEPRFTGLTRYLKVARANALGLANANGSIVRITKISGAGILTPILHASGETHRIHRFK